MHDLVILSRLEQENLVRAIEASLDVQALRQLFNWCHGALHGLLPQGIMVCMQFDETDALVHVECLNSLPLDPVARERLCDPEHGLALRLARHCAEAHALSFRLDSAPSTHSQTPKSAHAALAAGASSHAQDTSAPLSSLRQELARLGLSNVLVQGTGRLAGGSTCFALFEMSSSPSVRHEFFLTLMLPHLHLAFLRVLANRIELGRPPAPPTTLSEREQEVLSYAIIGKTNIEIAMILALSPLTVKNHLRNIYRKLQVSNRVQALARSHELRLFSPRLVGSKTHPSQRLA